MSPGSDSEYDGDGRVNERVLAFANLLDILEGNGNLHV